MSVAGAAAASSARRRPAALGLTSVLAVCAHPDDESFGLGAVLDALADDGATVAVLSFTRGESSTLGAGEVGDLGAVRALELQAAADVLGVAHVDLLDLPDGGLNDVALEHLRDEVVLRARRWDVDALLAFDLGGVTGHPDHHRATEAALAAAQRLQVPVLLWAIPDTAAAVLNDELGTAFRGRRRDEVDVVLAVDRSRQRLAIAAHTTQATDNPVLWRRLQLLGDEEWLRWA